jgi:hypothetical protein
VTTFSGRQKKEERSRRLGFPSEEEEEKKKRKFLFTSSSVFSFDSIFYINDGRSIKPNSNTLFNTN